VLPSVIHKLATVMTFALCANFSIKAQIGMCLQQHLGIPLNKEIQNPFSGALQSKITFFSSTNKRLNGVIGYSFTHFFDKNDFIVKRRNHGIHYGLKFQNVFSDKLTIDLLGSYNFMSFQQIDQYDTFYSFPQPKSEWTQYGLELVFNYKLNPRVLLHSGVHSIIRRVNDSQNSHVWLSAGIGVQFIKS
jgi:hypothetical protein